MSLNEELTKHVPSSCVVLIGPLLKIKELRLHPSGSCQKKMETSLHVMQRELKAGN